MGVSSLSVETDLLFAANSLSVEVEKDAKATTDSAWVQHWIWFWVGQRKVFLSYHDTFYSDNIDVMPIFVSLAVLTAKILEKDISSGKEVDVARDRVDMYIRSSVHSAFSQASNRIQNNPTWTTPYIQLISYNSTHFLFLLPEPTLLLESFLHCSDSLCPLITEL